MARSELPPSSNNEWLDPQGQVFQLCVIHEVEGKESIRSLVTIGGYSVCRECLDKIVRNFNLTSRQTSIDHIIKMLIETAILNANVKTDNA